MAKQILSSLNLVSVEKPAVEVDPVQAARKKMIEGIAEQMLCVQALIDKKPAATKTVIRYRDTEDGEREKYEKEIKIRPWFFGDGRKWVVIPRYGNRTLFDKDQGFEAKSLAGVRKILDTLGQAVSIGEVDAVLKKLKAEAFKKKSS